MDNDPIIYIADIRKVGICVSGARRWFAAVGLDFREFMENGIPASQLDATGDVQALRVTAAKRESLAE